MNDKKLHIETQIKSAFVRRNCYLSKSEVAREIGVPRTTILSSGIDSDKIGVELGFPRLALKTKGGEEENKEYLNQIIIAWKQIILREKRRVSLSELSRTFGKHETSFYKFKKYGWDEKRVHEECGVRWSVNKKVPAKEDIVEVLKLIIREKKRYVTRDELGDKLGCSGSLISFHKIDVSGINMEFGYTADWRGYEMLVRETFKNMYPQLTLQCQKTFDDCKSTSKRPTKLRYDFYCVEWNVLIEIDGPAHSQKSHMWYNESLLVRDGIKTKYALDNNIPLFRLECKCGSQLTLKRIQEFLSGIPLKLSVGQPAAKPSIN